jgi:hypothetical protein
MQPHARLSTFEQPAQPGRSPWIVVRCMLANDDAPRG